MNWIKVTDALPIQGQKVLCIDKERNFYVADYERITVRYEPFYLDRWNHGFCCGREPFDPTHWMEIPQSPKK